MRHHCDRNRGYDCYYEGVIAFGYMLNEMGHTLSKMREESEVMERDLQTISKVSKYYNL